VTEQETLTTTNFRWPNLSAVLVATSTVLRKQEHILEIADKDKVDNLLGQAQQFEQYEPNPDLALLATVLIHTAVSDHSLVDGNKRLGAMLGGTFILMNDMSLDLPEIGGNSAYTLVMMPLVEGSAELQDIAHVVRANLHPIKKSATS
jgi:prophage maintenance system killer protein